MALPAIECHRPGIAQRPQRQPQLARQPDVVLIRQCDRAALGQVGVAQEGEQVCRMSVLRALKDAHLTASGLAVAEGREDLERAVR